MKTNQIKSIATIAIVLASSIFASAQNRRDRDDDRRERYDNDDRRDNDRYHDDDDRDDRYYNYNDRRNDDDRIRDYERNGRNDYRRNPYDSRNLPNNWQRYTDRRFDWFRFDIYNNYDPRWARRYDFDLYYPWDPNNPYDIRNQRDYYGSARYWSGHRPTRIIIVPPAIRFGGSYGYRHNGYRHDRGRHNGHYKGRRW